MQFNKLPKKRVSTPLNPRRWLSGVETKTTSILLNPRRWLSGVVGIASLLRENQTPQIWDTISTQVPNLKYFCMFNTDDNRAIVAVLNVQGDD